MNIYAPAYQGQHNLKRYIQMEIELASHVELYEPLIVDIDFLFDVEIISYFDNIFRRVGLNYPHKIILLASKDKKRLRKARKILEKYMFIVGEKISMREHKYWIQVNT